ITAQTSYDFTTDSLSAYNDGIQASVQRIGNNRFALFSGDVNQDGTIDIMDLIESENKAAEFQFGYYQTDCNGDGATDLLDLQYMENNGDRFLYISRPQ
ncbi:MAG: Dockerin type domain, partial [Bacteroidota bacterium]